MMALLLRIILFFFLYQLFRSFFRKPKIAQAHPRGESVASKKTGDEAIVEAEYRVIKE